MHSQADQVHLSHRCGLNISAPWCLRILVSGLSLLPATLLGQGAGAARDGRWLAPRLSLGGPVGDRMRLDQLLDSTRSTSGFLLRSPSSITPRLSGDPRSPRWALVPPTVTTVYNSAVPYSGNDGALWAGRGFNVRALAGLRAEWGPVRLIAAPELAHSANRGYAAFDLVPRPPATLSRYANPWLTGPDWVDLPLRFGDSAVQRLYPGQSSLVVGAGSAEIGVATENEWWGPAVRNALVLSNNAPGFPHLFLRTGAPIQTRIGAFEGRWLVGGLTESRYFDADPSNDLRSISLMGLTWQPKWERDLTIGAARAVFAPADNWGAVAGSLVQVFANVPPETAADDTERDQLFSLFFRWVFPNDGFETYAEWARAEQPVSLRDFLVSPNHSQAYTIGLQWIGRELAILNRSRGRVRVRGEVSFLEQSTTFRFRPLGTWYTSPRVIQGYTNEGQALGAEIGPGSSSQYLGIDYLTRDWHVGVFAERLRSLEDAHSLDPNNTFCNHDVSFLPGLAAGVRTRFGSIAATYSSGWRINTYFLTRPGTACLNFDGLDVRSNSLSISFSPMTW
jgi:hypothetical protein